MRKPFSIAICVICSGCTSPNTELKPSARKLDFLQTRLTVSSGSADEAAQTAERELQGIRKIRSEIDVLSMEAAEIDRRIHSFESRLKQFSR